MEKENEDSSSVIFHFARAAGGEFLKTPQQISKFHCVVS